MAADTGKHVPSRPPRKLKPPTGSTIVPVYAYDATARTLHQMFQLPNPDPSARGGGPWCVLSVHVDTGVQMGDCVVLPSSYRYMAVHRTTINA
jgi:hypothetical protein